MSDFGRLGVEKREGRVSSNELPLANGQARDITAKKIGLSPITFQRTVTIIEKASEEPL